MELPAEEREAPSTTWSDAHTRASLQVLAEGAAALGGFGEAAIRVRRGNGLEVVATAGPGTAEMIGTSLPVEVLDAELANADHWGVLRFVPHERVGPEVLEYSHLSATEVRDVPDAWHPIDLLMAPLLDDEGVIRGLLTVDSPVDGCRPGPIQRAALISYAGVARTQVLLALEREELQARVRLSIETRAIVRQALGEDSLDKVVEASRIAIADCFNAAGMWLSAFDSRGGASTVWWSHVGYDLPMFAELDELAVRLAHLYWKDQRVAHLSRQHVLHPGLMAEDATLALDFLESVQITSALFVPLGTGTECLGYLVLARLSDTTPWTEMEHDAALDIGHDLGRAIANARQLEQERALVDRLRELDRYRTDLMNTVAHELRNPLASVSGHLELIEEEEELSGDVRRSVEAAIRGAGRLEGVIEGLLATAHASDPDATFDPVPVDLRSVVAAVVDECAHAADARSITITISTAASAGAFVVPGLPDELHRVLANLLSNAVKYSHDGASVSVLLAQGEDEVVFTVVDQGLGISDEDQLHLFKEFFRSNNPEALTRPGSGLGLVIVDRIVRRHGGRLDVESSLGHGTSVTARLPSAH
ncbi:MAG: HAMP domain-containing sensor histidine kinase [Nocardioides sp.]|uniref:sensor histidine kinase n=1 Tax=Nocardioides sp. TaxID=35761 RepID=UPI0032630F8E